MAEYKLNRDIKKSDYPWLDRDFKAGEIVHSYSNCTYGCISPDGIACCEIKGEDPFFEIPLDSLDEIVEAT